jgi:hypothetical protein
MGRMLGGVVLRGWGILSKCFSLSFEREEAWWGIGKRRDGRGGKGRVRSGVWRGGRKGRREGRKGRAEIYPGFGLVLKSGKEVWGGI